MPVTLNNDPVDPSANSYASLEAGTERYNQLYANQQFADPDGLFVRSYPVNEDALRAILIDASKMVESAIRSLTGDGLKGRAAKSDQALQFPRAYFQDRDGLTYEASFPPAMVKATLEQFAHLLLHPALLAARPNEEISSPDAIIKKLPIPRYSTECKTILKNWLGVDDSQRVEVIPYG